MSIQKFYNVIGIMSGTSMDGMDFSYIKTDGKNYVKIIAEKSYQYSYSYKKELKYIVRKYHKNSIKKFDEDIVTRKFTQLIKKFIIQNKINKNEISFIGLSGQTIFHDPKNKKTIQLGSCRKIHKKLNIKIIGNFRDNDIRKGGQGAPIGAFYHKYIIENYIKNSAILNIGGISNISFIEKKIITFDVGPGNCLIDKLMMKYYNKHYDKNGEKAFKGKINIKIINVFKNDIYFEKKYPKSLDKEYFNKYLKPLSIIKKTDSISTATYMTVLSIKYAIEKFNIKAKNIYLTGGGRNNKYIFNKLKIILNRKNIKIKLIEKINFNGDMLESQAFGYIAARSYLKLPISLPTTTGVKRATKGGIIYK